jgi:hypothetical protein
MGLCAAVVLAFGVPMAVGAMGSTQNADQQIAKLKTQKAEKEEETAAIARQIKTLQPKVQALAWNVSPDQLRQDMIRKLSAIAQSSGATLVTTRPSKPRDLDVMTEVSIEMHLSTSLPSLVKFLYPLQQPDSRFSVDRLRMSATNTETNLLDVDLTVSAYTLQPSTDEKAAATTRRAT